MFWWILRQELEALGVSVRVLLHLIWIEAGNWTDLSHGHWIIKGLLAVR